MRDTLFKLYWKLERKIVPGLRSSQYSYFEALISVFPRTATWLDVGCGHNIFGSWMDHQEQEVISRTGSAVGIDLDLNSIRKHKTIHQLALGSLENLPFESNTFDVVSANMVVEHLEQPLAVLRTIHRVLKPGGAFVFHTTNRRNPLIRLAAHTPQRLKNSVIKVLENRKADDVYPTWYRFNRAEQVREIAAESNFEIVRLELVSTSALTVMLGPLVTLELLWIRWLNSPDHASWRTNLIGVLRKR